jgi:DNA-binding Lrp family transcriptional regulator
MVDDDLDNLDRRILHLLQVDARGATDTEIAGETDVTGTTVSNRIQRLEAEGVIRGYHPELDYEKAGYPLNVLFICSTPLSDRSRLAGDALEIRGVVSVREMLAGRENIHVEVVAESTSDVKEITELLDELGLEVMSSNILAHEEIQPWNHFHQRGDHDDGLADESEPDSPDEESGEYREATWIRQLVAHAGRWTPARP